MEINEDNRDDVLEQIKKIASNTLEKHLRGQGYYQDWAKRWGNNIIQEIEKQLKEIFEEKYGIIIAFYMSDTTAYVSNHKCVYYSSTDFYFIVPYNTKFFYSEVRVFLTKIRKKLNNFIDFINPELSFRINQKMVEHLDRRKFIFDKMQGIVENIAIQVNNILLEKKDMPCSYHICFINELPTKGLYFTYKAINLEYAPVFCTFTTPTCACHTYLFMVNN